MAETIPDTHGWWAAHRLRYNLGLLAAGAIAYVSYALIVSTCTEWQVTDPRSELPEISLFTLAFQIVGFGIAVGLANVAYLLGPGVERLLRPADARTYRRVAFGLGFAFSVSLPFAVPAMAFASCSGHLSLDGLKLDDRWQVLHRCPAGDTGSERVATGPAVKPRLD